MKPLGLIVAGGKSERFGSPKILHEWEGIPQWKRLYSALQSHCSKIILNIPANQKELFPSDVPFDFLLEEEQNGPLVGLCTAFEMHPNQNWLVVASDHFWVEEATFSQLIENNQISVFKDSAQQIVPWLCKIPKSFTSKIVTKKVEGELSFKRILEDLHPKIIEPIKSKWIIDIDDKKDFLNENLG